MIDRTTFCSLLFIFVAAFSIPISANFVNTNCDENCTNDNVTVCYQNKNIRRCYAECLSPNDVSIPARMGRGYVRNPRVLTLVLNKGLSLHTVPCRLNRLFCLLCSKVRVL